MPQIEGDRPSHEPVLLTEILQWLRPERGGLFIDCTLGLGGHTAAMLAASPETRIIGIDQDEEALTIAGNRLAKFADRVQFIHANFRDVEEVLKRLKIT